MLRFFFERIYILDIKGLGLILLSGILSMVQVVVMAILNNWDVKHQLEIPPRVDNENWYLDNGDGYWWFPGIKLTEPLQHIPLWWKRGTLLMGMLQDYIYIFFIIFILHLWTIYLWVPGNLKGLQIFTMNNIIK